MTDPNYDPPETSTDDLPLTSAADVESAGRSCVVIIALAAAILVVVLLWIGLTTFGVVR